MSRTSAIPIEPPSVVSKRWISQYVNIQKLECISIFMTWSMARSHFGGFCQYNPDVDRPQKTFHTFLIKTKLQTEYIFYNLYYACTWSNVLPIDICCNLTRSLFIETSMLRYKVKLTHNWNRGVWLLERICVILDFFGYYYNFIVNSLILKQSMPSLPAGTDFSVCFIRLR